DPFHSTFGRYNVATREANAEALTNSKDPNAILVGGTIFGSVTTGPGGKVIGNHGSVGDIGWAGSQSDVQPGHQTDDANVQFDDVLPPFVYGSGMTPVPGLGPDGITSYPWVLGSGNYQVGGLNINGGKTMIVTNNATLYINGNFSCSGSG